MEILTSNSFMMSLIVLAVTWIVDWVWLRPKKLENELRQQGIPGSSYRLLVGDLTEFKWMQSRALTSPMNHFSHDHLPRVDPFRHHLVTKYGKTYFIWAGPIPMIHILVPEMIREALTMNNFQKLKFNLIADKLFPGVVSYDGAKWVKHRKIINPAFHVEKLKLMLPAFIDSCTEMICKWEEMIGDTGSNEVDVCPYFTTLSADVISRASFGSNYYEGQRIFELLKEQIGIAICLVQSIYIPGMRYIPTSSNKRFKKVENELHTLLKRIISKRKEAIEAGEVVKDDLLSILMDSNLKEIKQGQQLGMSLEEVIDECKLFYLAGQETTSILLVWTMMLLSKHQDWQARAREEVMQTFGKNVPHFEGLNHLKTVTMILYEVLRLYPPVPQLYRKINKDV